MGVPVNCLFVEKSFDFIIIDCCRMLMSCRANSRRAASPVPSPRTMPTRRSMRSSSAAADRDMKLLEASALEDELEALRGLENSKLDPDVEAEYLSRIETLRNNAAAVGCCLLVHENYLTRCTECEPKDCQNCRFPLHRPPKAWHKRRILQMMRS